MTRTAQPPTADVLSEAIDFAIDNDGRLRDFGFEGGIGWLRAWRDGDEEAAIILKEHKLHRPLPRPAR